jgi:hypothetical protein
MSFPHSPAPAKIFMSLISSQNELICQASQSVGEYLGKIDLMTERLPFDFTSYYEEEMGKGLFRRFVFFEEVASPERVSSIKGVTDRIEEGFRCAAGRKVNIDPGYLNLNQVILATHKDYSHRIYLRDGVYADLTLVYLQGGFQPLHWTYPDYRSAEIISLFNKARERYLHQLKKLPQLKEG